MQPIKKRNVTFIYPSLSCLMQVKYETLIHRYTLFLLHYQFIKSAKCIYYAHCNIIKSWINEPTFPGSRNHNQNESRPNVSSRLKDYLILQNYCNKMQPNIFFPLNIIRAAFPRFALFMSFYIIFIIKRIFCISSTEKNEVMYKTNPLTSSVFLVHVLLPWVYRRILYPFFNVKESRFDVSVDVEKSVY